MLAQVGNVTADTYNYLKPSHEQYQDIIINNVVVSQGVRECNQRYEAIVPILQQYNRPFTLCDIGASQGYFSFRVAHDFPQATCVMIEGNYSAEWQTAQQLQQLCELNTDLNNIILLQKKISVDDLMKMSECEHIDVTLVFNVAHHFGKSWRAFLDGVFSLGDHVIIETPTKVENVICGDIEQYIIDKGGVLICETPRHTNPALKGRMYFVQGKKEKIVKAYLMHASSNDKRWHIQSNFDTKYLIKQTQLGIEMHPWIPGINLLTFKLFNGTFPTSDMLIETLNQVDYSDHVDPFIWNMILQGRMIVPIDGNDETLTGQFSYEAAHALNLRILAAMNLNEIVKLVKSRSRLKPTYTAIANAANNAAS